MKAPIQERQRHTSRFDLNLLTYEVLAFRARLCDHGAHGKFRTFLGCDPV